MSKRSKQENGGHEDSLKGKSYIKLVGNSLDNGHHSHGSDSWNTRHLPLWMDEFSFVAELAKWQVDNRDLTENEMKRAILAYNSAHPGCEEAVMIAFSKMDYDKAKHRASLILQKYCCDENSPAFEALSIVLEQHFMPDSNEQPQTPQEKRQIAINTITMEDFSDSETARMAEILNAELPFLQAKPIGSDDIKSARQSWQEIYDRRDKGNQQRK